MTREGPIYNAAASAYRAPAMAQGATIYVFAIELADADRAVSVSLDLRVARHPSETAAPKLVTGSVISGSGASVSANAANEHANSANALRRGRRKKLGGKRFVASVVGARMRRWSIFIGWALDWKWGPRFLEERTRKYRRSSSLHRR